MNLYAVYDTLAQESGPLFEAKNDEVAKRSFMNLIFRGEVLRPDEYSLFLIGRYDHENMEVFVHEKVKIDVEVQKDGK